MLKLSLQNYALAKADSVPDGFVCTTVGAKHHSCHCWNDDGTPCQDGSDCGDDPCCDVPNGCLMYKNPGLGGDFRFVPNPINVSDLDSTLGQWGVPDKFAQEFHVAALTSSADFKTFDFLLNHTQAHFEAHIGSLRKDPASNLLYLGYTFGTTDAQLIQPYKRTVRGGDCHGTTRGQIARGFTNLEVAKIDQGLEAYAFKKAAANIS